jgi:hypothetical protein
MMIVSVLLMPSPGPKLVIRLRETGCQLPERIVSGLLPYDGATRT